MLLDSLDGDKSREVQTKVVPRGARKGKAVKFRAVSETGVNYLYTGSLRWRLQGGTLVPESFAIIGGRVICNNGSWQTNYYITDHLGCVRTVTDANGNVLAEFDYTPTVNCSRQRTTQPVAPTTCLPERKGKKSSAWANFKYKINEHRPSCHLIYIFLSVTAN